MPQIVRTRIGWVLLCFVLDSPVLALPGESQFQVNSYTPSTQARPAIATASDGRSVVVWWSVGSGQPGESLFTILGKRFDPGVSPVGVEFVVDESGPCVSLCRRIDPTVASSPAGEFVVVWQFRDEFDQTALRGRRFSEEATPLGPEFGVADGDDFVMKGAQDVAMLDGGAFVVTWADYVRWPGPPDFGILSQRFDASGAPIGGPVPVNALATGRQLRPAIAATPGGGYLVTWQSEASFGDDDSGRSVQARRFDAAGLPVGPEFQANSFTTGNQLRADAASAAGGEFVIVWESWGSAGGDTSQGSVQMRRFSADGSPAGSELQVNQRTAGEQGFPAIAVGGGGDFLVAWWDEGVVRARRFASSGDPLGDELQISGGGTASRMAPAVTALPDGDYLVAWSGDVGSAGDPLDAIEARRWSDLWIFVDGFETGDLARWSAVGR